MLISKFNNSNVNEGIAFYEEKYTFCFPDQYKKFLHKYNGGFTPETSFRFGKISSDIKVFYGLGKVKHSLDEMNLDEWLESFMIPIACDSFGNYINIGISNDNYGKIYFQDHEFGGKIDLLCADLITFLKSCISEMIDDEYKLSIEEREADLIARGKGANISDGLRKMWQAEIDKYANIVQEEVEISILE